MSTHPIPIEETGRLKSLQYHPRHIMWVLLALMMCGVAAAVVLVRDRGVSSETSGPRLTHVVRRGDLAVTVAEKGTLESSRNTEIKCQVRGGYGGRGGMSTVTSIIPSGSFVKAGDVLIRLDTKVIEETISLGKTDTNNAKAALARAEADLANARIAVDSYVEGRFRSQLAGVNKQLEVAKRNLSAAKKMLRSAESLFERGYVTDLEVEGNRYSVKQAELELHVRETEIDVLQRITKQSQLDSLQAQLKAAQSRLEGRKAGVRLEQGRLDLAEQEFHNCEITAERDGLVIYPSTAKWKDTPDVTVGASVRHNQILLLMPDLTRMQVKVGIHESIVDRVSKGLSAKVALPNKTVDTTVSLVASVASPAGWWTGNAVHYDAIIDLPSLPRLKPGMTAEVEITIARHRDVLSVPVEAVLETPEGHFCWVEMGSVTERRALKLGDSNDTSIVIEEGLQDGDVVILNPLLSVAEARALVEPTMVHVVGRGELVVSLTEQGTLESSNNKQIKCRVRGESTVNWVIESGTSVRAGDELVVLENKQIEEYLHERTKFAHLSLDAAIGFRAEATRAKYAIDEYVEGQFVTELLTLEKDQAIAEQALRSAQDMLRHAELMAQQGYVSQLDVERREFAVQRAELETELRVIDIDVLKNFTKEVQLETLRGTWESAKAAANGHEEVLKMDEARMALAQEEISRCTIRADRSGLVIYPKAEEWKNAPPVAEGATVHNDQVLLLMPDLSQMQVSVGIHETMVEHIKPGMVAKVTLPHGILEGEVTSVASTAKPAGWWTGNIVKYDAVITLPKGVEGLKPGMSAEVEIIMDRQQDVLLLPLSSVVEDESGCFCWVETPGGTERRELELGSSSDTYIAIESGLNEGEQVLLSPARGRD